MSLKIKTLILLLLCVSTTSVIAALNIQHWTTPEGAKVLFTQTKGLPMLDIQLNFAAASSTDGKLFGLASLTNSLLGTATKYQNEEQIINGFESVGAQFSNNSLKDMAIVSLRTLTRAPILKKSLDTFAQVVGLPDFQQRYLTRAKRQTLRAIKANQQSPARVASNAFSQAVFAEHPYAHQEIGTPNTLSEISIKDVQRHYQQYYVAKNLSIALVGDISRAKAKQVARQISHGLNIGKKAVKNPIVSPLKQAQNIHIEFPSKQTHLLIGQTGINRTNADYYPLYLGNHIFGGIGLSAILNAQIREQQGLAYSAYSYFTKMQSNGYFLLKLQTKNQQTSAAKNIALQALKDFISQPIDEAQLTHGKDNIIGGFALETSNNSDILTYLSVIGFYDLPLDYLANFVTHIKDISAKDIQTAFNRLIDMDKLIILSVGKK